MPPLKQTHLDGDSGVNGFIILHRKLLQWGWHDSPATLSVFIHLLLMASWRDTEWHDTQIKRGQVVTSLAKLAEICGISMRQTRTALDRLKKAGAVTIKSTNRHSLITIENYSLYQSLPEDSDKQSVKQDVKQTTSKRHASDNILTKEQCNKNMSARAASNGGYDLPYLTGRADDDRSVS